MSDNKLKTEVKKGVTVIHTNPNPLTNSLGHWGIFRYNGNRFAAEIQLNYHKYRIGLFDTLEDAVKAREIAEMKVDSGEFEYWFNTKPNGHKKKEYEEFWKREFELFDRNT